MILAIPHALNMFREFFLKVTLLLCICLPVWGSSEGKSDIKVVEVDKVTLRNVSQTVRLIGTIQGKRSTVLTAKAEGILDYIAFVGEKISKGSLVATLENIDLEKTHTLSVSAEKNARDQYDRIVQLEKSKLAKKQDVEDRKNQWIEAQKALNTAKIELDKTRFLAPFDGVVGGFKVREGVQVKVGDPIVVFYDPSELIIEFDIPTPILHKIYDSLKKTSSPFNQVIIEGKKIGVPNIQKMIDPDTHMTSAYIDYKCHECLIGSLIPIDLIVAQHKGVLVVPYEAVFLTDGNSHVYIVQKNKAILRPVELGIRGKDKIEIKSGIAEGDLVVTRGQERLAHDMTVKIFEPLVANKIKPKNESAEKKTSP